MLLLNLAKTGSARDQIAIEGVKDDILLLGNNQYRAIILTSSVNIELKSEAEQDAIIETYRSFLNSLDGQLQIIIRTREIDLDGYLAELANKASTEEISVYQDQLISYAEFIKGLVNVNRILSRNFYVVVSLDTQTKQDFGFIKEQIALKTDITIKGLQRLGMHGRSLSGLEILNLFYSFYNPKKAKTQPLSTVALRLMHQVLIKENGR